MPDDSIATASKLEELRGLLAKATARPWVALDEGKTLAIMKGKCPPLKQNGYPVRRWPEIVAWTGFDASDVPWGYRRANLHLMVEAVNALPSLLDEIERLQAAQSLSNSTGSDERVSLAKARLKALVEHYGDGQMVYVSVADLRVLNAITSPDRVEVLERLLRRALPGLRTDGDRDLAEEIDAALNGSEEKAATEGQR